MVRQRTEFASGGLNATNRSQFAKKINKGVRAH